MNLQKKVFLVVSVIFTGNGMLGPVMRTSVRLTVEGLNVAVLGSGIAGSTVARQLADAGVRVTVFECGRGVGGRTSTRVTRTKDDDDGNQQLEPFSFDHGAQYISEPKTEAFRKAIGEWKESGFVREWKGRFADVISSSSDEDSSKTVTIREEVPGKAHYVGYPAMNSICKSLLQHENIRVVLQTRACATFDSSDHKWTLTSHAGSSEDRRALGRFDWLVGSDRLSATDNRADLREAPIDGFKSLVNSIGSVPSLTLMVAFESPLRGIHGDGLRFDEDEVSGEFGALGWIARDTSKPGRERSDGGECWVVQSGSKAAERVMMAITEETATVAYEDYSFEKKRQLVREKAKEVLLGDFLSAIPKLGERVGAIEYQIPKIVSCVGHRWSAAFPLVSPSKGDSTGDCYVNDSEPQFVACGDYLGRLAGRVEGAYLSGASAAGAILKTVATKDRRGCL